MVCDPEVIHSRIGGENNEEKVKERKIPVTRDQAHIEAPASPPTLDQVLGAQKYVGEVLWLLTRSRPDLMYGVSRMDQVPSRTQPKSWSWEKR